MPDKPAAKYPLLEEILAIRGLPLKATFSNRDSAQIFNVSVRTIQNWIASGDLRARTLPGRASFLPRDLEEFLVDSNKEPSKRGGR